MVEGGIGDEAMGHLLEALKPYNGAVNVDDGKVTMLYSFDSGDLPGLMSGLTAAIPRAAGLAVRMLREAELADRPVVAISVERVG